MSQRHLSVRPEQQSAGCSEELTPPLLEGSPFLFGFYLV